MLMAKSCITTTIITKTNNKVISLNLKNINKMKHIFKIITVVLLVFSAIELNAQTSVIDFTLTSKSVNISGQNVAITSTFNKTGNSFIWTLLQTKKLMSTIL